MKTIVSALLVYMSLTIFFSSVSSAWDGKWTRESQYKDIVAELKINDENQNSFRFVIQAYYKQRDGQVKGVAQIMAENIAVYEGKNNCKLTFKQQNDGIILLEQTSGCNYYGGVNVTFNGTYLLRSE